MLRSKFRVYDTPLKTDINNSINVINATCALHNFIRVKHRPNVNESEMVQTARKSQRNLLPVAPQSNEWSVSFDATIIRDRLANYFSSAIGSVPWQNQLVDFTSIGRLHVVLENNKNQLNTFTCLTFIINTFHLHFCFNNMHICT